jgi:hypothetical protein
MPNELTAEMTTDVDAVREYLSRMAEIRGTGGATKETSYYSALENLLNQFGKTLKPHVICNGQLRNEGAGNPDFGLYTKAQIQAGQPRKGQLPERGVIEVKGLADNTWQTAKGTQATKYFDRYGLVLVTNYREFRLIGDGGKGKPIEFDRYTLAADEAAFWTMAGKPSPVAHQHTVHFKEFLHRAMMTAAPLARPEDVAWFLASYARDALQTLNQKDASALDPLRKALETALGIRFQGESGDHFFKSTLIQTLFYGVFSAWVVHARQGAGRFNWKAAAYTLTVPMVKALFEQIATPSKLGALGLMPVLDRTADALNRVDQTAFFKTFDTAEAVQHFYEPFLQAYDPQLRKDLGVWYTPQEIVTYMVERVDRVLRTELGKPNGLADNDVVVLDPCCGTGTYIVAVLRKIEETLRSQGADDLLADDIKQAAKERVFGFELMSAPFVVAHWQVGSYLAQLGAPLDADHGERAGIYLTNSLTGWEPPTGPKATLPLFPELAEERDAAEHVKRDVPILVILGNPPYNAFAGTSPVEEQGLVEPYKKGLSDHWHIRKYNLDELYVRFMRVAERRIAEGTKQGIVCFISSFSYLADPSFVVMRERLLEEFDSIWIDCLNGDSRETGKRTPSGAPDPSIFSTPLNSAGIRLGTAIGLFVKKRIRDMEPIVRYREFWGRTKREDLLESLANSDPAGIYTAADPNEGNRFAFRPRIVSSDFRSWPRIVDLCDMSPISGLQEMRHGTLMALDRNDLQQRMNFYFDPARTWEEIEATKSGPVRNAGRFTAKKARERMLEKATFSAASLRRYSLYPFDNRWAYWTDVRPLWNEPRPALVAQMSDNNRYFITRMAAERPGEGIPATVTTALPDYHLLRPNVAAIPFMIQESADGLFATDRRANLSTAARTYLQALGLSDPDADPEIAALPWLHSLALCFSPLYLAEHRDGILSDWPRMPMPDNSAALRASAALGSRLATILNPDISVPGVTAGNIDPRLSCLGVLTRAGGRALTLADLSVSAGWGYRMETGVVMPGGGKADERAAYTENEATILGAKAIDLLGLPLDIRLNSVAAWQNGPAQRLEL